MVFDRQSVISVFFLKKVFAFKLLHLYNIDMIKQSHLRNVIPVNAGIKPRMKVKITKVY